MRTHRFFPTAGAQRLAARGRLALLACLAALALLAGAVPAVAASASQTAASPASAGSRCSISYLQPRLHLASVTVDSAAANATGTFTQPGQAPITGLPAFCDVTLTQTDAAGNPIHIDVWLPSKWNGRFQGVGGAGYECGPIYTETATAIQAGYASAATDCGVPPAELPTGSWALNSNRTRTAWSGPG